MKNKNVYVNPEIEVIKFDVIATDQFGDSMLNGDPDDNWYDEIVG